MIFPVSVTQLIAIAGVVSAALVLAFFIGVCHERDSKRRAVHRVAIGEARKDPEIRKMAADVRRRCETRKLGLRLVQGGKRERGEFA
jgi:hypothetical protein